MTEIQLITNGIEIDTKLLPLIKKFTSGGATLAEIGLLFGYTKKDIGKFIKKLENKYPDLAKSWEIGVNLADTALVATAFAIATGYSCEETKEIFRECVKYDSTGKPITVPIKTSKEVKTKHVQPNPDMLKFLLVNRLPEYFSDKRQIDITKHTDLGGVTEEEIRQFAGRLMEVASKRKQIESKEVVNG